MPEPRHREVRLRITQVFTECVVIPIVPGLALGKKQADRQTFQVFTGAAPGGSSKNLEGLTGNVLMCFNYFCVA